MKHPRQRHDHRVRRKLPINLDRNMLASNLLHTSRHLLKPLDSLFHMFLRVALILLGLGEIVQGCCETISIDSLEERRSMSFPMYKSIITKG